MLTPENIAMLAKLAPFARRARCFENGREKMAKHQKSLAFLLLSVDISENSRNEALKTFHCPIYQALTADEIRQTFGMADTKMLGFRRGGLSTQLEKCFEQCRISTEG